MQKLYSLVYSLQPYYKRGACICVFLLTFAKLLRNYFYITPPGEYIWNLPSFVTNQFPYQSMSLKDFQSKILKSGNKEIARSDKNWISSKIFIMKAREGKWILLLLLFIHDFKQLHKFWKNSLQGETCLEDGEVNMRRFEICSGS